MRRTAWPGLGFRLGFRLGSPLGSRLGLPLGLCLGFWPGMGCVGWGQVAAVGFGRAVAEKGDVGGVVVSARGGQPIAGAVVTLAGTGGGRVVATTRSDGEGRFLVRGMRRGKYALQGEARGFVAGSYQEHDEFSTAIAVGMGFATDGLRLELKPEAAIRGRVVDEVGDGVRDARVTIYRETHGAGRREVLPRTGAMTDDRGEYQAGPLPEGRYFVSVSGRPWWAVYPRGGASAAAGGGALATGVDPALDVAFPLTFAPGVTDSERAGVVMVKAGEVARADVAMVPVRAVTLTMQREAGGRVPTLQVPAFGGGEAISGETEFRRDGMEVHGLAPGEYRLQMGEMEEKVARVTLGAGGAEMSAGEGDALGTVAATVTEEGGGGLPAGLVLLLLEGKKEGAERDSHVAGVGEKGQAQVRGLPTGSYRVLAFDQQGAVAVERLEVAGKEVRNGALPVGAGSTEVHVVVKPAVKGVEGVVERGGRPVAGAMVVLVPVDLLGVPEMYRRDQSDQDGTFTLRGVVPGRYIVVAVEGGWALNWSERGVMERYLGKGIALEVKANERGEERLPGALEAQAAR